MLSLQFPRFHSKLSIHIVHHFQDSGSHGCLVGRMNLMHIPFSLNLCFESHFFNH